MAIGDLLNNVLGGQQQFGNQQYGNPNYGQGQQNYGNQGPYNNGQPYGGQPNYNGGPNQNYGDPNYGSPSGGQNGFGVLGQGNFNLQTQSELYCLCRGTGIMFAKKGSMVAYKGDVKFSKRLLGTNDGNIASQLINHATRKMTGENLEIMEINALSQSEIWLADLAAHCTVIDLEPNGPWNSICVESEDLLAFTAACHYGVTPLGVGVISQKGLFTSKLTYHGEGAKVCIKTNGNPLVLTVTQDSPVFCDPDAMVAFTGAPPSVKTGIGLKTLIGQTSGESYSFCFSQPGQQVIIQPYERESGFSIRDTNRPQMQNKPKIGSGGQSGSFVEDQIGNALKQFL